jgi:hypothetical protein
MMKEEGESRDGEGAGSRQEDRAQKPAPGAEMKTGAGQRAEGERAGAREERRAPSAELAGGRGQKERAATSAGRRRGFFP